MSAFLKSIGLRRTYEPYNDPSNSERDPDDQIILLECHHPAEITDQRMTGARIDIYDSRTVRVWTSQNKLAAKIARDNGFQVRLLDREAELYIPSDKADMFLHRFGAKVKRDVR